MSNNNQTWYRLTWNSKLFAHHPKKLALSLAIFVGLIFISLLVTDRNNIFTINAVTEKARFIVTDPLLSEWSISGANFLDNQDKEEDERNPLGEDTILIIETGTDVEIVRHGIQKVSITLRANNNKSTTGTLITNDGSEIHLGPWASFHITPLVKPLILPFSGHLIVGDDVTVGVSSVLLSGQIGVVEEQLLNNTRYTAGSEMLDTGDRIHIWKINNESGSSLSPAVMNGFIRIEPTQQDQYTEAQNAMHLIAHGQASYVEVQRLGSAGYTIRAPKWARIMYDPFIAFLATFGALLLACVEIYSKTKEIISDCAHNGNVQDDLEPVTHEPQPSQKSAVAPDSTSSRSTPS